MRVHRVYREKVGGIPDYYAIHLKWADYASETGDNYALQEAYRFARLAEEFGQAEIDDADTVDH